MKIQIGKIEIGERHRVDMGDLEGLAESIRTEGLLHPIGITKDSRLVFGQRRLAAVRDVLGWHSIEARTVDVSSIVAGECAENIIRKDFTPSERVAIARTLREVIGERRGRPPGPASTRGTPEKVDLCPPFSKEKTRDFVARAVGFKTGRTLERAEAVVAAAEEDPERFGRIAERMDDSGKPAGAFKALQQTRVAARLQATPPPAPSGRFDVVVIDPPWRYDSRAQDVTHRAANPYPDMTVEEIRQLPIYEHLNENAIVWLWATNAFLRDAYGVADSWGLRVRTMLTWGKDRFGTGDWLRGQTEHCLLCTFGKPLVTLTSESTLLTGAMREHSRKPDSFFDLVLSLCPGSRLEWFARESREGFVAYGAEAGKFDEA